jgi:hypothetical protein
MQRGGGGGEAAVAFDGVENLQRVEGYFHVKKTERSVQNNSLFMAELYAVSWDEAIHIVHKEFT